MDACRTTQAIGALLLSGLVSVAAAASQTTYTISGVASGMVGNESVVHDPRVWVPFTDTAFSITADADLVGFVPTEPIVVVPLARVVQITLQGLGEFTANANFALIVDHPDGIGALTFGDGDVEFTSPVLMSYDGTSSIGPIAVQTYALDGTFSDVELVPSDIPDPPGLVPGTELELTLTAASALTFAVRSEVSAVPEPAIAWLVAPGLLAIVGRRRRGRLPVNPR